jgi:amino acid adenylation domain-containing protein
MERTIDGTELKSGHTVTNIDDVDHRSNYAQSSQPTLGLSGEAAHAFFNTCNLTDTDNLSYQTISQAFEEQVKKTPENTALVFAGHSLTYAELNSRANQLAHVIRYQYQEMTGCALQPDSLIPLYFDRSFDMVISMLAVLKAGGAYLPLSPEYPEKRLQFILEDAQARLLLTQESHLNKLSCLTFEQASKMKFVSTDTLLTESATQNLDAINDAADLAYVIYTSGSTGKPKGVLIEHQGVTNLVANQTTLYSFSEQETVIWLSNYIFDASIETLFLALFNGAKLLIPSADDIKDPSTINRLIVEEEVTHIHGTPSYLAAIGECRRPHKLKRVVSGGEACLSVLSKTWGSLLINSYGPTETTITVTNNLNHSSQASINCLGKPVNNIKLYVLGEQGELLPVGSSGELHVSGVGVARGYLNRPQLTAERFIDNPFTNSEARHTRLYKTGDVVRWMQDGKLEFIGRSDRQVKIRGHRIELGEVESAIATLTCIDHALVLDQKRRDHKYLVAYMTPKSGSDLDVENVRDTLASLLPDYMIPTSLVVIDEWPLTLNGKIDHKALPIPKANRGNSFYVPARDAIEREIADIWAAIFDFEPIGIRDDFFALGGDSIAAIRFMSTMEKRLNRRLNMKEFRQNPTIVGIVEAMSKQTEENPLKIEGPEDGENRPSQFPLSSQQMVAWYMFQSQSDSKAYLAEAATHFKGHLEVDALTYAINQIFANHDIYRTVFFMDNGEPVQKVLEKFEMFLNTIEASHIPLAQQEDFLEQTFKTRLAQLDNLSQLPLAEFLLVSFSNTHHVLLHQEHHIIHDGWSANEFTRELIEIYHTQVDHSYKIEINPPAQYSDFMFAQRDWLKSSYAEQQLEFWRNKLAGSPNGVALFGKKSRSLAFAGDHQKIIFSRAQWQAMEALCQQLGVTSFSFTSSILYLCLWRYSGQTDLSFGSAFANRNWSNSHTTLGMFVNTLVLRQQIDSSSSLRAFLTQTQATVDEAQSNEELPFIHVVEALNPERDGDSNPFFNVLLGFHDTPIYTDPIPGMQWHKDETVISDTSKFDIDCLVVPRGETFNENGEVHFLWEYRSDVYTQEEIASFLDSFKNVFLNVIDDFEQCSDLALEKLDIIPPSQAHLMVNDWGRGKPLSLETMQQFSGQDLVSAISAIALSTPDKLAVSSGHLDLTYGQLEGASTQLAVELADNNIQSGDKVAIVADRTPSLVIAMLAVFKMGACAVVIAPDLPAQRAVFVLSDSGSKLVLSDMIELSFLIDCPQSVVDITNAHRVTKAQPMFSPVADHQNQSGYIIYTSGSTGVPKGVEIGYSALINDCLWHVDEFKLNENSVGTSLAYVGFDAFMAEVWPLLMVGGQVVLLSDNERDDLDTLSTVMARFNVTHTCLPTGLLEAACARNFNWPQSLDTLLVGGDKLGQVQFPADFHANLFNLYGPTETTVDATFYKMDPQNVMSPPIGRPIANATARVVIDGQLAPVGVPGELYIGGAGVAKGYLNQPELTEERFVEAAHLSGPEEQNHRYYKTGDLVRWRSDGQLEFLGRLNDEVKVRGYRVALGEISSRLLENAEVSQAIALVREEAIYAYITLSEQEVLAWQTDQSNERVLTRKLRGLLKQSLPVYMRPNAIVVLANMPMTAQGKIDKTKLLSPLTGDTPLEIASTETEKTLVAIWQDGLTRDQVGVTDNFFSIGGHSLLAMKMIGRIRLELQVELKMSDFFTQATIRDLASYIDAILSVRDQVPTDLVLNMEEGEI